MDRLSRGPGSGTRVRSAIAHFDHNEGGIAYQVEGLQASVIAGNTAEPGPGSSAMPLEPPVQDPGAQHMTEEGIVELGNALQNDPRFERRYRLVQPRLAAD